MPITQQNNPYATSRIRQFGTAYNDVEELIQELSSQTQLGGEGYQFQLAQDTGQGFRRVYISNTPAAGAGNYNLYLDLRIGPPSPGGSVIEMGTGSPGTYGVPGFTRHVGGAGQVSTTLDTFKDFLRSIYAKAPTLNKPPQAAVWSVYQKGYAGRQYPAAGIVLGPASAGTGQEALVASEVRPFIPEETPASRQAYYRDVMQQFRTPRGGPAGLEGYYPEPKDWNVWRPASPISYPALTQGGLPTTGVLAYGDPEKQAKRTTVLAEARERADVPLVYSQKTGRVEQVRPSLPTRGYGVRRGWTRASGTLPGETEPREGFSATTLVTDLPDMPGGAGISAGLFDWLYSIGTRGHAETPLGIGSMDELGKVLKEGGLHIRNLEGLLEGPGRGNINLGGWKRKTINAQGKEVEEKVPIIMPRAGYEISLGKPTLYIPQFYDPKTQGGKFSNVPMYTETDVATTERLVEALRQELGDRVNVVGWSAKGIGGEQYPAEAYLDVPINRLLTPSFKGASLKIGGEQLSRQLKMQTLGAPEGRRVPIDIITGESKFTPRMLESNFLNLNMKSQLEFLDTFLPAGSPIEQQRLEATKEYVRQAYNVPRKDVNIRMDDLASVYYQTGLAPGETPQPYNADVMFEEILNQIKGIDSPDLGRKLWKRFGIPIPKEQMMATRVYSQDMMVQAKDIIDKLGIGDMVTFERLKERPAEGELIRQIAEANQWEDTTEQQAWQMRVKVPGGGKALGFTSMLSSVGEYTSESGYLNPESIGALMMQSPEIARELGLLGSASDFALSTWLGSVEPSTGGVQRHTQGWSEIKNWLTFQKDLNEQIPSVPQEAITVTPELAAQIKKAIASTIGSTKGNLVSRQQFEDLEKSLQSINPLSLGLEQPWDLSKSYLFGRNSMKLVPPMSAILGIEHFETGAGMKGQTKTRIGGRYLNYLSALAEAESTTEPGAAYAAVAQQANSFYSYFSGKFYPQGRRSKQIFRNVVGVNIPGARSGRYQSLSQLQADEAYAPETFVKYMLRGRGITDQEEINRIQRYLDEGDDAYLPVLYRRDPKTSAEPWAYLKLRSATWLKNRGREVPTSPVYKDSFYVSELENRRSYGDKDYDQGAMILLPFSDVDPQTGDRTGIYRPKRSYEKEFLARNRMMSMSPDDFTRTLVASMGKKYADISSDSLDVLAKTMADYQAAMTMRDKSVLTKKSGQLRTAEMDEYFQVAENMRNAMSGRAIAYNAIREQKIWESVLGLNPTDVSKVGESQGSFPFQMYLDFGKMMTGGYTQLETMLNTFGIYHPTRPVGGDVSYGIGFEMTKQSRPQAGKDKRDWVEVGGAAIDPKAILLNMVSFLSSTQGNAAGNAMLATGFARTEEGQKEVFAAISDPKSYWQRRGFSTQGLPDWAYTNRGDVMSQLVKSGAVGFDSPYFMMLGYHAVERFQRQFPEFVNDPGIKFPWGGTGEMMPIADILRSKEYKLGDLLTNFMVRGKQGVSAQDMELLADLGGESAVSAIGRGLHRQWRMTTGGRSPLALADAEMTRTMQRQREFLSSLSMSGVPRVHASEAGTLYEAASQVSSLDWTPTPRTYKPEVIYRSVMRYLGYPDIFGEWGQEDIPSRFFKRVNEPRAYAGVPELMEAVSIGEKTNIDPSQSIVFGQAWEEAYKPIAESRGLIHVGQLKQARTGKSGQVLPAGQALSVSLAGGKLEVTGIPDFVGYDKQKNAFAIVDTKLAEQDPDRPEGAVSRARVRSYKYRLQQLMYAYGLEQKANTLEDSEWVNLMKGWGVEDEAMALQMRGAARQGRFAISLQPGHFKGAGPVAYAPVEIPYGQEERAEVEAAGSWIRENIFGEKTIQEASRNVYTALRQPKGVPAGMDWYTRKGSPVDWSIYRTLEQMAKVPVQAAGGGRFDNLSGQRIRVGEGGPEELVVSPKGQVTVVPTSELPESKAARGQQDIRAGYMGARFQGGGEPFAHLYPAEQPPTPATPPPQQPPPPPEPPQPAGFFMDPEEFGRRQAQAFWDKYQEISGPVSQGRPSGFPPPVLQPEKTQRQILTGLGVYGSLYTPRAGGTSLAQGWEQNVSGILMGALEEAGLGEEYRGYQGQPAAEDLFLALERHGVSPRAYVPKLARAGLIKQAKAISAASAPIETAFRLMSRETATSRGEIGTLGMYPEQRFAFETFRAAMMQPGTEGEQAGQAAAQSRLEEIVQTQSAASTLGRVSAEYTNLSRSGRFAGTTPEQLTRIAESYDRVTESSKKLEEAQLKNAKTIDLEVKSRESILLAKAEESKGYAQTLRAQAGPLFTETGAPVSPALRAQMIELGIVGEPEITAADQAVAQENQSLLLRQRASRAAQEDRALRIGTAGRRLFGGFGLMFMGGIARRIIEPTFTGYQEAMQEQAIAEQAFGGRFGGFAPMVTAEQTMARANLLRGGMGWGAVRGLQANMAMNAPGVGGALGLLGTGVSTTAGAMWMMDILGPALGIGEAAIPGIGLALGGLSMLALGGVETAGAYQDPRRAAAALTALQVQGRGYGQNIWRNMAGVFDPNARSLLWETYGTGRQGVGSQRWYQQQFGQMYQTQAGIGGTGALPGLLQGRGFSRTQQEQLLSGYAQMMTTMPEFQGIESQAFYQAMGLGMQYGLPLSLGQGGGMQTLGMMIQRGVPVEQLARGAAAQPFSTWQQQNQTMAQLINAWTSRGGMTTEEVQQLQSGAGFMSALGVMAPQITGETRRAVRERVEAPGRMREFAFRGGVGQVWEPGDTRWTTRMETTTNLEAYERRIGQVLGTDQARELAARYMQQQESRMRAGLPFESFNKLLDRLEAFGGDPAKWQGFEKTIQAGEVLSSMIDQAVRNFQTMGVQQPNLAGVQATPMAMAQLIQQQQVGISMGQTFTQGGMAPGRAGQFAQAFAGMTPQQAYQYQQMMSLNPMSWASWAMQNPQAARAFPSTVAGAGGMQVSTQPLFMTDISAQGQLTGLNWGTTSLAMPNQVSALMGMGGGGSLAPGMRNVMTPQQATQISSAMTANQIWGSGWQQNPNLSQGLIQAMMSGGTFGGQQWQLQNQQQYMRATSGIGYAQWELQQRYQPQFWALQDQMTGVQRGYQTWQLDFQQRQMEMQNQFWQQNMSVNRQQQMMQRGWTRQDWGYQDLTRGLQWQWRQEDFQEQARFMTGRERRLAERQMGRETMMYGLEGEQIDKQRQRQQELWRLEDRRYQIAVSQHQQEVKMQEEQLQRTRKYYDEVWAIQDKQRDLERKYWQEQQALQKQSLDASKAYNETQMKISQTMMEFNQWMDKEMGKKSLMNPETLGDLAEALARVDEVIRNLLGGRGGKATTPTQGEIPGGGQHEGQAGLSYMVPPGYPNDSYPFFASSGEKVKISDPWGTQVMEEPMKSTGPQVVHIILNLGNNRLAEKFVELVDQELQI